MNTVKPIIEIKGIGKEYDIAHQKGGYVTLRDILTNVAKRPFAFFKHKVKQVVGFETKEAFWALRDVSFDVMPGEIIGIIGANGAGKSTLLKILTGITPPTEGEIIMRGRVASLLEVGTGFHPELTGRENIFLNGAILGMTKKEIARKFDEIVAFSGVEKFLDTPVKYYSSGMYVRLAFSVAAHMEPDILLVDEVLAVGDAEFQKKCLGKMEEVTHQDGRTILFVSHNLSAIKQLCAKTVLIDKGAVVMFDETKKVIDYYTNEKQVPVSIITYPFSPHKETSITKVSILDSVGIPEARLPVSKPFFIEVEFEIIKPITKSSLCLIISRVGGEILLYSSEGDWSGILADYLPGKYKTRVEIPSFLFNVGHYHLDVSIQKPFVEFLDRKEDILFEILDQDNPRSKITNGHLIGILANQLKYATSKLAK